MLTVIDNTLTAKEHEIPKYVQIFQQKMISNPLKC